MLEKGSQKMYERATSLCQENILLICTTVCDEQVQHKSIHAKCATCHLSMSWNLYKIQCVTSKIEHFGTKVSVVLIIDGSGNSHKFVLNLLRKKCFTFCIDMDCLFARFYLLLDFAGMGMGMDCSLIWDVFGILRQLQI